MKKNIQKLIAGIMTVIVAFQFQVPTFAASEEKQYVSDIIVSYGEGDSAEADAKQWLTDNGYTVVDTNLNAGAESGASASAISWLTDARSARAVYLGYKTTTDSSQAITSLKTMNMTGNYSFDSYQEVLDSLADEIKIFMEDLKVTLAEWRANYDAGRGKAIESYKLLQLMYSPDNNNMKMGDLLLNETKEEMGDTAYNKLSDEEKLLHADMTTILMQGNSDAMKYIEQILAMGADTDKDKTWMTRLTEMGTYDDMMDALETAADNKGETFSPSDAAAELSSKYDSAAELLAVNITGLQALFKKYVESGTTLQDSENKVSSYIQKVDDSGTVQNWFNIGLMYESLSQFKYPSADNPDRTLQDFFMQEFDSTSAESRQELYPMAAALSDGQRSALNFVALSELITQGILTDDEAMEAANGLDEYLNITDSVSVFAGVDRSIYDSSSTALTSNARELQNSSQKSYTEGIFGTPFSIRTVISAALFVTCVAATVECRVTVSSLAGKLDARDAFEELVDKEAKRILESHGDDYGSAAREMAYENMKHYVDSASKGSEKYVEMIEGYEDAMEYDYLNRPNMSREETLLKGFKIASAVMVVVTIAMGVWTVISGVMDLRAYYNQDMDLYPIPDNMVDESTDSSGSKVYTYYKAVQSNRVEKGYTEGREALKDNADLNGDLGKEWLALYYTKDANAGSPITVSDAAGFTVVKGGETTPSGLKALTLFGNEDPVNLTNDSWVWNDATGGLYLYYAVDSAANTGSIFDGTNKWFVLSGIGVIIAACFFFGGYASGRSRRRKDTEDVPAEA